ncbi:QsdR family transcriptional regulator [Amycolatopsis sp. QT-25]|uniref:QsdR family transcriptional regulator n=1 Tax=Amycolatopsis sp. QT-25 TaxID=3034022 RepID=UPI0023EC37D3|nr:QsdR family transcriptional regulator [Amycolatopsis sp. QT-25]WET77274.1 QsdR family transcriptional regulator [Amycolatopsis sp. QT-25]
MNPAAEDIVRTAARWIDRGLRVDTSAFAQDLGISRSTLFRRVGNREDLLGDALYYLSERTLTAAVRTWEREEGDVVRNAAGELRCLSIMREYRSALAASAGFRRFLDDEPVLAIRLLTDPDGRVQPRVIAAHVELLRRDVEDGGFLPAVGLDSLCYAIVRLGEAFLYSDVLASRTPDLEAASTLLGALVEGRVPSRTL